jgi:predicted nucleic acid-binding protein
LKAIDLKEKYRFSFWDSLVIQAAIQGQARILLSEDLPDGQVVKDLKIVNPFTKEWKDYM